MNEAALSQYCETLWSTRGEANSILDEIASFVAPNRQGFATTPPSPGDEGRDQIWDSTPEDAALTLAAALHGMLTNPATDWLTQEIAGLGDDDGNREHEEFMQHVTTMMLDMFSDPSTGFQQEVNTFYLDLVCLGWAVFYVSGEDGRGLRFRAVPPSQCAIAEDADGRVDTVLRRWMMTPSQMIEEFGAEALSDTVKAAIEGRNQTKTFGVSHVVAPRSKLPKELQDAPEISADADMPAGAGDRQGDKKAEKKRAAAPVHPIVSVHYETESKRILRAGGYFELPYMVPRWSKRSGEVYGRGPGHAALPDMRVLNRVALSQLTGAEKLADPPLLVANDSMLKAKDIRTHAGGITYFDRQGGNGGEIQPLPVQYKLDVAELVLKQRRDAIRAAFLNDRIQLAGGPQMTATEVIARERKQNLVLGPVLGRLEAEFLGPLTGRVFLLLYRAGLFAVPEDLQGAELRARYVSPIGRAQRQGEAEAFARALQYLAPLASVKGEILDNFDTDVIARDTRDLFGYPRSYLVPEKQVAELRKARAEAAQQQAAAEMALRVAQAGGGQA
jgi:hypothetical protein